MDKEPRTIFRADLTYDEDGDCWNTLPWEPVIEQVREKLSGVLIDKNTLKIGDGIYKFYYDPCEDRPLEAGEFCIDAVESDPDFDEQVAKNGREVMKGIRKQHEEE